MDVEISQPAPVPRSIIAVFEGYGGVTGTVTFTQLRGAANTTITISLHNLGFGPNPWAVRLRADSFPCHVEHRFAARTKRLIVSFLTQVHTLPTTGFGGANGSYGCGDLGPVYEVDTGHASLHGFDLGATVPLRVCLQVTSSPSDGVGNRHALRAAADEGTQTTALRSASRLGGCVGPGLCTVRRKQMVSA